MSDFDHALINVVMLSTTLLFSVILLCATLFKHSKSRLDKPFSCMVSLNVVMQLAGIAAWAYGLQAYPPLLYRIVLAIDFFTAYAVTISFLWYFNTLLGIIRHPDSSAVPAIGPGTRLAIAVLSILDMGLYISSYWTGWFFTFNERGLISYTEHMVILQYLCAVWQLYNLFIVLKNRRYLGRGHLCLLIAYVAVPIFFFATDLDNQISLAYVAIAAINMLIYVNINMDSERRMLKVQTELARKEAEMSEVKMELMLMQIQPHFLYNALSTISYLCTHDPRDARQAINEFSSYLKGNMESINTKYPVPFETELAHVRNYLALEKRRFPSRLIVRYDIGPDNFLIPPLTLQTLVENSVRHGVGARFEPTTVQITTSESPRHWIVKVTDDGAGFDTSRMPSDSRQHIGLAGAQYRVQEMMGGEVLVGSTIGQGTEVTIRIPKEVSQ